MQIAFYRHLYKRAKKMAKKDFASAFPMITWLRALSGHLSHKDIGGFNKNRWMAEINGEKYINEISIPGSHDTCALYEPIRQLAKCQYHTVTDQLNMGVRYIDIRANVVKDDLVISHGPIFQGVTFDEIIGQCYDFLEKNPSETVIVSLKHELVSRDKNNAFIPLFIEKLETHRDMWYTENRLPKLCEVRGKLILFSRVENLNLGIDASKDWIHNSSSLIENDGFRLHIQDTFKVKSVEAAWELAKNHIHRIVNESDGKKNLSINFHSGILGYPHVIKVAKHVNAEFLNFIGNKKIHLGVAVFDFITPEICNAVIGTNK